MKIAYDTGQLRESLSFASCVATIGNFDGVHLGHRELLRRTVLKAKERGLPSVVITFDPHPSSVLSSRPAKGLCTTTQRLEYLEELGVDAALVLPFTRKLASESAADFCRRVLATELNINELFVGYDFRVGSDQAGVESLREFGVGKFAVTRMEAVILEGEAVSSTRIREALEHGELERANRLLGRPFAVRGVVVHGQARGGPLLGIPTANLDVPASMAMPVPAVYATSTRLWEGRKPGSWYMSVTSFGRNPTFEGAFLTLETHLMDFSADLYDRELEVCFLAELRKEHRFNGLEALIAQLHADMDARRKLPARAFPSSAFFESTIAVNGVQNREEQSAANG